MMGPIAWVVGLGCIVHVIHSMYMIENYNFNEFLERAGWIIVKNIATFVILMIIFSIMVVYIQTITDSHPGKHYYECQSQTMGKPDLINS